MPSAGRISGLPASGDRTCKARRVAQDVPRLGQPFTLALLLQAVHRVPVSLPCFLYYRRYNWSCPSLAARGPLFLSPGPEGLVKDPNPSLSISLTHREEGVRSYASPPPDRGNRRVYTENMLQTWLELQGCFSLLCAVGLQQLLLSKHPFPPTASVRKGGMGFDISDRRTNWA